eukprot:76445-Rhodomonas_salina.1
MCFSAHAPEPREPVSPHLQPVLFVLCAPHVFDFNLPPQQRECWGAASRLPYSPARSYPSSVPLIAYHTLAQYR